MEANIDDATPEQMGFLTEHLFKYKALDVFLTPIYMKKGRPASLLTVICKETDRVSLEKQIFLNSTTFGIRSLYYERTTLERESRTIKCEGITVKIKIGYWQGKILHKTIEYESVKEVANKLNLTYNDAYYKISKALQDEIQ